MAEPIWKDIDDPNCSNLMDCCDYVDSIMQTLFVSEVRTATDSASRRPGSICIAHEVCAQSWTPELPQLHQAAYIALSC